MRNLAGSIGIAGITSAHGPGSAWGAAHQAPQVLYGILGQQSLLVTYAHIFQVFGVLCLVTMPLIFFFKNVRTGKAPVRVQ